MSLDRHKGKLSLDWFVEPKNCRVRTPGRIAAAIKKLMGILNKTN